MAEAKGSFEVTGWDENAYEQLPNGGKLTEAKVRQRFTGDITGEGSVVWLMGYTKPNRARFVGLQRIVGTLAGRKGSFFAETSGDFDGTVARWRAAIVGGSGTDQLEGISGEEDGAPEDAVGELLRRWDVGVVEEDRQVGGVGRVEDGPDGVEVDGAADGGRAGLDEARVGRGPDPVRLGHRHAGVAHHTQRIEAGMAEAVGSFYEAVAGIEPLTRRTLPSDCSAAAATTADTWLPSGAPRWTSPSATSGSGACGWR